LVRQSLLPSATPAKAGAQGSGGSRLSPGKQFKKVKILILHLFFAAG
jgi:hypothetical protein